MSAPVIDQLNHQVTIDGFIVMRVCGSGHRFWWNSSIWMRSGRKHFATADEAFAAGIKALHLN